MLTLKYVVAVADKLTSSRPTAKKEHASALRFLRFVTVERCVLLGMLADAGDEGSMLVRCLDAEDIDVSAISLQVQGFLRRITTLFKDGQCFNSGYTRHVIRTLREPVLLVQDGGRVLGDPEGVPDALLERCRARLANWVDLARVTIRAELPEFEAIYAMRVLNLTNGVASRSSADPGCGLQIDLLPDETRALCESLANFIGVDANSFVNQLQDVRTIAQRFMATDGSVKAPMDAWRLAIQETQKDARTKRLHPTNALHSALMFYGAFGPVTSGVEQNFSQLKNIAGINRPDKFSGSIIDELHIRQSWTKARPLSH